MAKHFYPGNYERQRAHRKARASAKFSHVDFHNLIERAKSGKPVNAPDSLKTFFEEVAKYPNDFQFEKKANSVGYTDAYARFESYTYDKVYREEMELLASMKENGTYPSFWRRHPIFTLCLGIFIIWNILGIFGAIL